MQKGIALPRLSVDGSERVNQDNLLSSEFVQIRSQLFCLIKLISTHHLKGGEKMSWKGQATSGTNTDIDFQNASSLSKGDVQKKKLQPSAWFKREMLESQGSGSRQFDGFVVSDFFARLRIVDNKERIVEFPYYFKHVPIANISEQAQQTKCLSGGVHLPVFRQI